MSSSLVRVRFAPSPTGELHVGGARTALFNWLYARHTGGEFLLRIEDTDKDRSLPAHTQVILDGLKWLGLNWDKDIVYQGLNQATHVRAAEELLAANKAYRCFCPKEDLAKARIKAKTEKRPFRYDGRCARLTETQIEAKATDPYAIRFKIPTGTTKWQDKVSGSVSFENADLEDFVILRSDQTPVYNLAVVCDDHQMGITLVLRGDDHLSNTPKQILLYKALGYSVPEFGHLPMIYGEDRKKLSKRTGATAVGSYADMGYTPEAMLNFLALLGWSPGDNREILSLPEMIKLFTLDSLNISPAIFGLKKLSWMNAEYIANLPDETLWPQVKKAIALASPNADKDLVAEQLEAERDTFMPWLSLAKSRAKSITDLAKTIWSLTSPNLSYDPNLTAKWWLGADTHKWFAALEDGFKDIIWSRAHIEQAILKVVEKSGATRKEVSQALRVAITGQAISPPLEDVLALMTRHQVLDRLRSAKSALLSSPKAEIKR